MVVDEGLENSSRNAPSPSTVMSWRRDVVDGVGGHTADVTRRTLELLCEDASNVEDKAASMPDSINLKFESSPMCFPQSRGVVVDHFFRRVSVQRGER